MKRLAFLMFFLMYVCVGLVSADEQIGVFANSNTNCIQFINPLTMETSDPLLAGELGSTGGGLFDVVIAPNGKTAFVSNFGDGRVFCIDISGGFSVKPVILGNVKLPFFAEDMAVTPDGKYLVVTDGGFSARAAVIVADPYLLKSNNLGSRYAQAVDIRPDGRTVVFADYSGRTAHAYTLQSNGTLVHTKTVRISPFPPVNVAISPNGKIVIMPIAGYSACVFLYFDALGVMHFGGTVAMPFKNGQSCVFNSDGTKAYYLSNSQTRGTKVVVLNVTYNPPGVSPSSTSIKVHPMRGTSQLFGVDTIALDPSGNYLYVTNPTLSGGRGGIAVLDLALNIQVDCLPGTGIPVGIAFTTIPTGER